MIGSIIGDIVGSIYEFHNIKTKEFPLFSDRSDYTDDSILSIATAKWILEGASKSNTKMQSDLQRIILLGCICNVGLIGMVTFLPLLS